MLTTSCQVKIFNRFKYLEVNKPIDKHRLKFLADKFYHFIFLKAFYSAKSMTCFFNGCVHSIIVLFPMLLLYLKQLLNGY